MSKLQENSLRDNLYKVLYYIVVRESDNKYYGSDGRWWDDFYEAEAFDSYLDASSLIDDLIKESATKIFGNTNDLSDEELDKYLNWEDVQKDFYSILEITSSDYDSEIAKK